MSPPPAGAPRAKYKSYISRGGSPEAAVDGVVSLRPRGSQGQLKFSRAFPLSRDPQKISRALRPWVGGRPAVHYPLRGRSVHFQRVLASPASFTAANMIHIGRVQSIETRGIPVLSLLAELSGNLRKGFRRHGRRVSPGHWFCNGCTGPEGANARQSRQETLCGIKTVCMGAHGNPWYSP